MAQLTINVPAAQVQRLKDWIDRTQPLQYDPNTGTVPTRTDAEYLMLVREALRNFLRSEVRASEEKDAIESARASVPDLEVTD